MQNKILTFLVLVIMQISCAQNLSEQEMKTIVQTEYDKIPKHTEQHMYALQIDKMGCKISILINNMTIGDYLEEGGFSTTSTLNGHIIKSGKQTLTLKVYPREGMQYIDDLARVTLQVLHVRQKGDPIDSYKILQNVELPKDLKEQKLPYYEMEVSFEAKVPWDHSAFYDNLQDLRKVPYIEKKLLAQYQKVKTMVENNRQQEYIDFRFKNKRNEFEAFYVTQEEVNEYMKWYIEDVSPLPSKEVIFNSDYEIVFEKNGKIAFVVSKKNQKTVMKMEYGEILIEGDHKGMKSNYKYIGTVSILPKGKTELETL